MIISLPFRVNIFLSWEGAYRLYLGQVPFKDFGLPMGFGYWLIPALFFKVFGPSFLTLVKAQVLINIISILSLRGILYNLKVKPLLVSLALVIFCLSYVIYNFWPWYNHSVVVFELAAICFLTSYLARPSGRTSIMYLFPGALFAFLSFFTKQDAGAICLMLCLALLTYHSFSEKKYFPLLFFAASYLIIALVSIVPFLEHDFLYWFNYGQPPHNARIGFDQLINVFFVEAVWEKIYLSLLVLLLVAGGREKINAIFRDREQTILMIITLGLIGQAIIHRVSSPLPTDHMTYFHVFGIVLLIRVSPLYQPIGSFGKFALVSVVLVLSFSQGYWKYIKGHLGLSISKKDAQIPWNSDPWVSSSFKGFEKILMPKQTVEGIQKLLTSDAAKNENLSVLNMSELTPLALEMDYTPPTDQPLWYHLNIGIFQKEVIELCERVKARQYDLVLFEDIPGLIHFYPYQVRDTLRKYYRLENKFLAPRKLENSTIEVYVKPEEGPGPIRTSGVRASGMPSGTPSGIQPNPDTLREVRTPDARTPDTRMSDARKISTCPPEPQQERM